MSKSWKKISVALLMAIGGAGATAAGMSHNAHASTTPTPTTSQTQNQGQNQNQSNQSGTNVDNVHVNQQTANNVSQASQMQQQIMNNVQRTNNNINNVNSEIQNINNVNKDNHGNVVNGQDIANAGNLRNLGTHFVHLNLNYIQPKKAPQTDNDIINYAGDPSATTSMRGINGTNGHANAPQGFHYAPGVTGNFKFNNGSHTFNVNKDTPATDTDAINYVGDPSANTNVKGANGSNGHVNAPQGFHYAQGVTGNFKFNNGTHNFNVNKDTPATDTDAINYVGDPSANTNVKGANGSNGHVDAPQGFHYAQGVTGNFKFNNGTHNFNVSKNAPATVMDAINYNGDPSANTTEKGTVGSNSHVDAPQGYHYVNGSTGNFTFNNGSHTFDVNQNAQPKPASATPSPAPVMLSTPAPTSAAPEPRKAQTPQNDVDAIDYAGDPSANTTEKGVNGSQGHADAPQGYHYAKGVTGNFQFNNGTHTFDVNKDAKPFIVREAKAYRQVYNNVLNRYKNTVQYHNNRNNFDQLAKLRARQIAQNFVSPQANTNYKLVKREAHKMGYFAPRDHARVMEVVGTGNFKGDNFRAPVFVKNVGKYSKRLHSKKQYVAFADYYSPKLGRYVIDGVFANKAPRKISTKAFQRSQRQLSHMAHKQNQDYYMGDNLKPDLKYVRGHYANKARRATSHASRAKLNKGIARINKQARSHKTTRRHGYARHYTRRAPRRTARHSRRGYRR